MRDIKNNVDVVQSIKPASLTATTNGAGVDLRGYDSAMVVVDLGVGDFASANEVYTPKMQESDDNSNWGDVAAGDMDGAFTAVDENTEDETIQRVGYRGNKRYIRGVLTLAGTTPAIVASCTVVRGHPHQAPVA